MQTYFQYIFTYHFFSKPKFLDKHVNRINKGWDLTKDKATERLDLLNNTKAAWEGYYAGLDNIAAAFEKAEEEIKKVKKRFHLQSAIDDLAKRKAIFDDTKKTIIDTMYAGIQKDYDTMTLTLPEDKKDFVKKEVKAVTEKLEVVDRFRDKVGKIDTFVTNLQNFNKTLMMIDSWMTEADNNLDQIKNHSDKMTPEDRVSVTMELQEDVFDKVRIIQQAIKTEEELLPQGETVPKDAQDHKDELKRIEQYVLDLQQRVMHQCELFSDDIKCWAEYRTGIKEFRPWLETSEKRAKEGLSKPTTLDEANALFANVNGFDQGCLKYLGILENAESASLKMTTHKEADEEVKALKERYEKVKLVSDEWMKKADTLVKEWKLLDNTVNELNSWVAKDRGETSEANFSLEKMESTLGELKNIFKEKERLVENL